MAKVVYSQKLDSIYDDLQERHHRFPKTYLNQVKQALGDWIVYYRPTDSIRNGVAYSGTAHWMFDRGLITLDEDLCVVTSSSLNETMHRGLIVQGRKIRLPDLLSLRPSDQFLEFHRENIFHE